MRADVAYSQPVRALQPGSQPAFLLWSGGYSLDLDSAVFERSDLQQGTLRGPNPRKHERPSHYPLATVLAC
jgi:hypothetical protein